MTVFGAVTNETDVLLIQYSDRSRFETIHSLAAQPCFDDLITH